MEHRSDPAISIIIPVWNEEQYLKECLDSLLTQTFQNFEVICVDDGSTDRSLEILRTYEKADRRFHVYHQNNQHAGVARNFGMKQARGKYLLFLDADDFFHPQLLSLTFEKAESCRADICLFGADSYDLKTKAYTMKKTLDPAFLPEKDPFFWEDCPQCFFQITAGVAWNKLCQRDFIRRLGLRFQSLPRNNDFFFSYAALASAQTITSVHETLLHYRQGGTGNLQSTTNRSPLMFCRAYRSLKRYLMRHHLFEPLEHSFVNKALESSLYNLRTHRDGEVKAYVANHLVKKFFKQMGVDGHPAEYFYRQTSYDTYCTLKAENKKPAMRTAKRLHKMALLPRLSKPSRKR